MPGRSDRHIRAVRRLRQACVTGDTDRLRAILHPAVVLFSDGGETVVTGSVDRVEPVAHRMIDLLNPPPGTAVSERSVNGRTGLLLTRGEVVTAVISFGVRRQRIDMIWVVLHPDRLRDFNS